MDCRGYRGQTGKVIGENKFKRIRKKAAVAHYHILLGELKKATKHRSQDSRLSGRVKSGTI
jgi:hypothetical protein